MTPLATNSHAQLEELQNWYIEQCNGDWEHSYGITIGTLDNPGWSLTVDLRETGLQNQTFATREHDKTADDLNQDGDWFVCRVEEQRFLAHCGPRKLEEVISIFLAWARFNA